MDDNENAEFSEMDSSCNSPQPVIYTFCADDDAMDYTYEVGEIISMAPMSLAQMIEEAKIVCVDDDVDMNNLQNMEQFTATRLSDGQQEIVKPAMTILSKNYQRCAINKKLNVDLSNRMQRKVELTI